MIEIDVKRLTAQLSDSLAKADHATRQGHDALANGEESMASKWLSEAEAHNRAARLYRAEIESRQQVEAVQ